MSSVSRDAYLAGWKLRLLSGLLRAPVVGPRLARFLAARILAPLLEASEEYEELAPLFAPPAHRHTEGEAR